MAEPGRKPRVTEADALDIFDERDDAAEPLTATEVGDALNCSRKTAYNKLTALADAGDLASKKVGGRSRVWWVPLPRDARTSAPGRSRVVDDVDQEDAASGRGEDVASNRADRPGRDDVVEDAGDQEIGADPDRSSTDDAVDAALADVDLPGSGAKEERRRRAVRDLYDHLRENGTATRAEFLELIDADVVGYASPESFWTNCVKATDALASLPDVEKPGEGEHTWRYVGSA